MTGVLDDLRKRLKRKPGVVLSDEEIEIALLKTPERTRERAEAEVENMRFDIAKRARKPRKFGGLA